MSQPPAHPPVPVYVLGHYNEAALALLQSTPTISPVLFTDPAHTAWPLHAVAILIRARTRLTAADFAAAPKLKYVVKQGVGVDAIDLAAAARHGVRVYNTPAVNAEAVAELSLALALAVARRVCEMDRAIRRGERLLRAEWFSKSLYKTTVGVVGMGNIGREVAAKWRGAMQARVVAYDPYFPAEGGWPGIEHERAVTLGELLEVADVVTVHVPLTEGTRGLIGREEMARMKDGAILINAARGGVVDEEALLEALRRKKFWGVGLDACNVEPPTLEVYREFLEHENLVMMPHVGGDTVECQIRSGLAAVETLIEAIAGGEPKGRQA
ncbi:putative D-3-phosphoglycerate dehydrogenase [Mytilinidion resinicola]|uniref:D-3-phosphoglycerate dehydrogenase n=1 Tax=Mytilinidion resinicola TaxID=574789 RepID=A0A6A6YS12_9PEZI|nr:putative D-3-phosphoglycerate dehydrogenase [Mytilinidion resinicola]KAF2811590.1 putative D-3-phosphoglycerate dehydrogenase [Mytilinidion resinicola]